MPTSYTSNLRLALPVTGELSGTWGDVVNSSITTLLDDAVGGYVAVTISPTANTQALTANNGITDEARNAVLKLNAGTVAAAFELYAPPSERTYVVWNNTGYTCTFYVATIAGGIVAAGTGLSIPTGKKVLVYLDGTNVLEQLNYIPSLTLGAALPVTSGGTGVTTSTGTGNTVLSNSPTLVTPALGTPASGVATNLTGLPLTTGVTGVLPTANGGTNLASFTSGGAVYASSTSVLTTGTLPVASGGTGVTTSTGTGNVVLSTSPTLVTPALGTPTSGVATNLTGLPLTTGVTGTLPVANGGTGVTTSTGTGNVVFSDSPTLVTPALGTPTSGVATNLTGLPLTTGVTGTLAATNGGTGYASYAVGDLLYASTTTALSKLADVATGSALISGGISTAPSWGKIGLTTHVSGTLPVANGGTGVTASTGTGSVVFGTTPSISNLLLTTAREFVTVSATAATGTVTFSALTQAVLYYTTNASGNWTLNVRGDGSTTLNTMMATGQTLSIVFLVTNGATAYYQSAFQIDGVSVTPKWISGVAPTAGVASAINSYTLVIIKTGASAYTVLASLTTFA